MPGKTRNSKRKSRRPRRKNSKRKAPKKSVTWHDKMRKTTDTKLRLNKWRKKGLKERVSALEGNQSKHYDTILGALSVSHKINWNGVSYTGGPLADPRNSYKSCLSVTPVLPNGDVQRLSGDAFAGQQENQRVGCNLFAKSLRLRGQIHGLKPKPLTLDLSGVGVTSGAVDVAFQIQSDYDTAMAQHCYTKVWMVVLEDLEPSQTAAGGISVANDYEAANTGESPIESIAQHSGVGFVNSTLETFGYANFLKSYQSTRFRVKQAQAYVMTALKPYAEFDVTIDINKELIYEPLDFDQGAPSTSTRPLNYGILVYFLCHRDVSGNPSAPDYTKMFAPEVKVLTSRLKFLDT